MYAYQKRAVDFIKNTPNCAIWADMGLGKSSIALTAVSDLIDSFECRRALIVAPLRVARKVHTDEATEWQHLNHLTFSKIIGDKPTRRTSLIQPGAVHLINRENLPWLIDLYFDDKSRQKRWWPYDTVILDESQSFKSQSALRWKKLRMVRKLFPRMIQLTGTPTPNGYAGLWSQMFLLDRGQRLGQTERAFRQRWFDTHLGDGYATYTIKPHAAKEIQERVSDIVLSLRAEDYLDLPPVKYNPVRVQLRARDRGVYNRMERKYIAETTHGVVTAANAGVCSQKLLQLSSGFLYTGQDERKYEIFHNEKVNALLEVLEGSSGPVMIAHNFIADRERIVEALKKFCTPTQRWAIADSDADLEAFAKGAIDFLVIHPASAGHGLNLHGSGSETIVWFNLPSSLELYSQLNARLIGGVRRLGKNVIVHHIIADATIDERWFQLLKNKETTQDDLTRAMADRVKELKL